ncbi:hypothetical protein [Halosegnis longus]|uniref:hypothetical protein n=1 Tax=Halosegnis longus TaxID=2216012 RepID=UPI00129D2464|nr:hypothetical protein [Halosegnis longus]
MSITDTRATDLAQLTNRIRDGTVPAEVRLLAGDDGPVLCVRYAGDTVSLPLDEATDITGDTDGFEIGDLLVHIEPTIDGMAYDPTCYLNLVTGFADHGDVEDLLYIAVGDHYVNRTRHNKAQIASHHHEDRLKTYRFRP